MKVKIERIDESNFVEVSSEYGAFNGYWFESTLPILNHEYHVELDILQKYSISDFMVDECSATKIETTNSTIQITGLVKCFDDDVLYIQLGTSLIAVEIENDYSFQSIVDKYVTFHTDQINLYDTDL